MTAEIDASHVGNASATALPARAREVDVEVEAYPGGELIGASAGMLDDRFS